MTSESPLDAVLVRYEFFDKRGQPLIFKDKQAWAIDTLAPLPRAGYYAEVATGKTAMSTVSALHKKLRVSGRLHCIVLMPPILLKQWYTWFQRGVRDRVTGKPPSALIYRGTPKERKQLDLDHDFVLMSIQVFKNDFEYLYEQFEDLPVVVIVDEATSIKNPGTHNYRKVRDFIAPENREVMLLTATPLSKPGDAYAYIKTVAPAIYRNQRHFEAIHVEQRDFFGNVTKWANLDMLAENMRINSVRILQKEVFPDIEVPFYDPMHYELEDEHLALYKKLADEQILLLKDGGKIDATTQQKLYTMLQQIVCNPGHFSGNPNMRSAAHELLDEVIEELEVGNIERGRKLIVYATYRMTNRGLLQYLAPYGAVGFFSEVSQAQQQINLARFVDDPKCRISVANPLSAGYGLDGLDAVCSDALFLETPIIAKDFNQAVGRLTRPGQTRKPWIRMAIAAGTVQLRLHRQLLDGDALVNKVQGAWQDLREAIYGVS